MSEKKETLQKRKIADPGAALTFIFTMLTICIWGTYQGIYKGPSTLALGLVQLACYIPYLICAVMYFLRGDSMNASIFTIFGTLFGGVGGFLNIAAGIGEIRGFAVTPELGAIPFFWGAVSLVPLMISVRKTASKCGFLCFAGIAVFLTLMALVSYHILPEQGTNEVIKWLTLFVAVDGVYTMVNSMLVYGGCKPLPEGKPFFK